MENLTFFSVEVSGKVCVLSDVLYYYRARKGSITRYNSVSNIRDFMLSRENLHKNVERLIPDVISKEQYEELRRSCLSSAILKFAGLSATKQSKEDVSALRKEIIEFGSTVDISRCSLAIRTAWNMLNKHPGALTAAYPVIRKIIDVSRSLKK